jgi:hypothetical protein
METDICNMIGLLAYKQEELKDLLTEVSLAEDAERKGQVIKDIEENIDMLRRREEELHVQRADVRFHSTVCFPFVARRIVRAKTLQNFQSARAIRNRILHIQEERGWRVAELDDEQAESEDEESLELEEEFYCERYFDGPRTRSLTFS